MTRVLFDKIVILTESTWEHIIIFSSDRLEN